MRLLILTLSCLLLGSVMAGQTRIFSADMIGRSISDSISSDDQMATDGQFKGKTRGSGFCFWCGRSISDSISSDDQMATDGQFGGQTRGLTIFGRSISDSISSYNEMATDCAAGTPLADKLASVLPDCLPDALDIPEDPQDSCPKVEDIKDYISKVDTYLDCIGSGLAWEDKSDVEADIASLPAQVLGALDPTDKDSPLSQCPANFMDLVNTWITDCGYSSKDADTINDIVEPYVENVCFPFTYLNACYDYLNQ